MTDVIKLKAFADDRLNVAGMMISILDRVENTVGKKGKCWLPAFSSFPTAFSKVFLFRVVKNVAGPCGKELNYHIVRDPNVRKYCLSSRCNMYLHLLQFFVMCLIRGQIDVAEALSCIFQSEM